MRKVTIIAPFWGNTQHVGNHRIDRFIRWFAAQHVYVTVVCSGVKDEVQQTSWGEEVTIPDPLRIYGYTTAEGNYKVPVRRPNPLRRKVAYLLFCPDLGILWAKKAARHPLVRQQVKGSIWILASNPPESAHLAALSLANHLRTKLIVDMRDGWLDEPLRILLQQSRFRRFLEGWMEQRVLKRASHIFVSSDVWKDLLEQRLSFTKGKVTTLTNAYPLEEMLKNNVLPHGKDSSLPTRITLLHTGQFTGSRKNQRVATLLDPLLATTQSTNIRGTLVLLGHLDAQDIQEVRTYRPQFESRGWTLEVLKAIPRSEAMEHMAQSDGLLLLAASQAAIPSKLFEYVLTRKPLLVVTPDNSAVWQLTQQLPQSFLVDSTKQQWDISAVQRFLNACTTGSYQAEVPTKFSEEYLSQVFLKTIGIQ
jgi:hypothetical protein